MGGSHGYPFYLHFAHTPFLIAYLAVNWHLSSIWIFLITELITKNVTTVGIKWPQNTDLHSPFFVFDTGYLILCRNIELIVLKNRMFFVLRILKLVPNFCLIKMEHFISVSERTCHKDPKMKKKLMSFSHQKSLKFEKQINIRFFRLTSSIFMQNFRYPVSKRKRWMKASILGSLCAHSVYTCSKSFSSRYLASYFDLHIKLSGVWMQKLSMSSHMLVVHVDSYLSQLNVTCSSGE